MTKIKICGITNQEDALFAAQKGADALGFVIETPTNSPRNISREKAKEIIGSLPPLVLSVGVVIPQDIHTALSIVDISGTQLIQIHGTFAAKEIGLLKAKRNVRVVRCVGIGKDAQLRATIAQVELLLESGVDGILLDTKGEKGTGGTGKTHDWALSAELRHSFSVPFILAGGITPENVEKAIDLVDPYAVDVSSGVESEPGKKDPEKISAIIQKVRNDS